MLEKIKHALRQFFIRKELPKSPSPRRLTVFEKTRTIGILFHADSESTVYEISGIARKIREQEKEVDVIGYCKSKEIPAFCHEADMHFFSRKAVNWLGFPSKSVTGDFTKKKRDILFTLSRENIYPLVYLTTISDATLKVGYHSEENQVIFDFMLKMEGRSGVRDFFQQTDHYLQMLNQNSYASEN